MSETGIIAVRRGYKPSGSIVEDSIKGIGMYTSEYSIYSDMIFQMLSRGEYAAEQIADLVGCPVKAVKIVAAKRREAIKTNHREYLQCKAIMEDNLKRTQDEGINEDVMVYCGLMRLVSMWGGKKRGKGCMGGLRD